MNDLYTLQFPVNNEDAEQRSKQYRELDPFSSAPAALLNSADIYDYARVTGLLWPFDPSDDKLKSASYEVDFVGDVHYCNSEGNYKVQRINPGDKFDLKMNSIAFIYLDTFFRLPDYIALRFNLKITHVHAGLLLGTGPLVDPGFNGRLLVPLHNLTAEDYTLHGGEGLIWVEFTKLSPHPRWDKDYRRPQGMHGVYRPFPTAKGKLTPYDFFIKAKKTNAPDSSIPQEIRKAEEDAKSAKLAAKDASDEAKKAKQEAEKTKNYITWGGIIALITIILPLIFGLFQAIALVQDSVKYVKETKDDVEKVKKQVTLQQQEIESALTEYKSSQNNMALSNNNRLRNGPQSKSEIEFVTNKAGRTITPAK